MANPSALRLLLEATSVPAGLVGEVLEQGGTPWLLGAPDEVVAAEVVLCHPPLAAGALAEALGGRTPRRGHGGSWPLRAASGAALLPWRVAARAAGLARGVGAGRR